MAKSEMCGLHCPRWILWLFAALGAWFTLSVFGLPTVGGFWSWVVLLTGVCSWVCAASAAHKKTSCPFAGVPVWFGAVTTIVGVWFVLGDMGVLPTFGLNLLYVATLLGALGLAGYKR